MKVGNFLLGSDLKSKFEEFVPFTSDERPANPDIKMHAGLYFHAEVHLVPNIIYIYIFKKAKF